MKPTSEILERMNRNSGEHPEGVYTRLYRYLLREDIYMTAYNNLYANNGAGTKGVDDDTADGFSVEYVQQIIAELKALDYNPKPVRRTYRKKKNGKMRPLGIPSFKDKLVQDAVRQILESIYEPIFSDFSHGFRPSRSCHTALKQASKYFRGTKWFIEGDIKGCFDNIDHTVLLNLLSKKIKDSKFVTLIGKFLKAGYMENWEYHKTYSGTPQGGILSPTLANIYLHELDKKVEQLRDDFSHPNPKSCSLEYGRVRREILKKRKQYGDLTDDTQKKSLLREIHRLETEMRKLPYKDATGRKIVYVRYADDFLIGVSGSRKDCEKIKQELTAFIFGKLKLELSDEKTRITHSSENARFLGYDINVRRNNQTKRKANGTVQRTLNQSVELLVPFEKIEQFMYQREIVIQAKDGSLIPWQRNAMAGLTDLEVLDTYNSQTRGICNYYSLASNFSKLTYFVYLMEYSCLKTLAKKHKTRISAIKKMYQCGSSWGIPYETKSGKKRMMIIKFSDLKKGAVYHNADTITHHIHFTSHSALEDRLRANQCELCGATDVLLEIHHINKIKNLNGKEQWEKAMIARKRKTLIVCKNCHIAIHHS
ncbi:MAG: group II intron reverse transcriptase/maturase [Ruminococcus sp.]|nr:group II intron reverse transcriptase/maturase [Ruminococcus sp.]